MKPEIYNLRYTIYARLGRRRHLPDSGCNRGTGDEASPLRDCEPMF